MQDVVGLKGPYLICSRIFIFLIPNHAEQLPKINLGGEKTDLRITAHFVSLDEVYDLVLLLFVMSRLHFF